MFEGLAGAADASCRAALLRPAEHNRNLQYLELAGQTGKLKESGYVEIDETLAFRNISDMAGAETKTIAPVTKDFEVDDASVVMTQKGKRYRLPRSDGAYDRAFASGWPRGIRECESERYLMNIHGTFYEMPRDDGLALIKPICTHHKQITDFCTWRGLLVLSGVRTDAKKRRAHLCGR